MHYFDHVFDIWLDTDLSLLLFFLNQLTAILFDLINLNKLFRLPSLNLLHRLTAFNLRTFFFTLHVLIDSTDVVVLATVGTLAVFGLNLVVVASIADLVLAVARVKLPLHFHDISFANIAVPSPPIFILIPRLL